MIRANTQDRLCELIESRLGFVLSSARYDQMAGALRKAASALAISEEQLVEMLGASPLEADAWQRIVQGIVVGETHFFRHPSWFAQMERHILAPLIAMRRRQDVRKIRIWSAGCATGEEPYTLVMLLDRLLPDIGQWDIRIAATDVNLAALATAAGAEYGDWALREASPEDRARYFVAHARGRHEFDKKLRGLVTFRYLNLAEQRYPDSAAGLADFDLIVCRNVLMYFAPETQRAVAQRLCRTLARGGWLAVSPAEAIAEWYRPLRPTNFPEAIFFRQAPSEPLASKRAAPQFQSESFDALPKVRPAARADVPIEPLPDRSPTDVSKEMMRAARALADGGNLAGACQQCEAALKIDPLNDEANVLLAIVSEEMGKFDAALSAARRAVYVVPHSAAAHFMLARVLSRLGNVPQARRAMLTVLDLLSEMTPEASVPSLGGASVADVRRLAGAYLAVPAKTQVRGRRGAAT